MNKMKTWGTKNIIIYQSKTGGIEFKGDIERDAVWGTLSQIASLFDVKRLAILNIITLMQ